jgi:hypothetical protein
MAASSAALLPIKTFVGRSCAEWSVTVVRVMADLGPQVVFSRICLARRRRGAQAVRPKRWTADHNDVGRIRQRSAPGPPGGPIHRT